MLYGMIAVLICCGFIDFFVAFYPKDKFIASIIAFCLAFVFGVHDDFDARALSRRAGHNRRFFTWLDGLAAGWLWSLGIICVTVVGAFVFMWRGFNVMDIPQPLETVAALAFWLIVAAFLVRGARQHWAANLEKKNDVCHSCGYDLRAHIDSDHSTVCPECGTPFVRLHQSGAAGR